MLGSPGGSDEVQVETNSDSPGSTVSGSEFSSESEAAVKQELGGGHAAEVKMLRGVGQDVAAFKASSGTELENFKKQAPELSREFETLLGSYRNSGSRFEQSYLQGTLAATLDRAPEGLESEMSAIRTNLQTLFESTKKKWKARDAAQKLALPNGFDLKRAQRQESQKPLSQSGPAMLKELLRKRLADSVVELNLGSSAGRDVLGVLSERGVLR